MAVTRMGVGGATALLTTSLAGLAVSTYLYVWPGTATAPRWLAAPAMPAAIAPLPAFPTTTRSVEVKPGDTLARALVRGGLEARVASQLAAEFGRNGADLRKIRPGAEVEVTRNYRNEPIMVRYEANPWLSFAARPASGGWRVGRAETMPEVRVEAVSGVVESSLFDAVERTGESGRLVLALVEIFSWDFDFTADTRVGDRFRLLVEKRYAGDAFVDYGRIVVAQYASGTRTLTGVGTARGSRYSYYDPKGESLKKTFLKSPLEFSRITSRFTYARPHPILGGRLPHLAVDYAAPTGTPVRAVADGAVSHAGWDRGYGLSVQIRHRSGYKTLYAHLSRLGRDIRAGARVDQRQVIGYVGSTGMSTGPHLHYEVIKNGQRVNPLSERFLPGEPIPGAERAEFQRHARDLLARLETQAPF